MATALEKFRQYRDEDRHECNLIVSRLNALLTSQSLFMTSTAIILSNFGDHKIAQQRTLLLPVAALAICSALLGGIAIALGCAVLRAWHRQGAKLIQDEKKTTHRNEQTSDAVEGCYLASRTQQPDAIHAWSIDVFGHVMPMLFILLWGAFIIWICRQ